MAAITVPETLVAPVGLNRWDSPWLNAKFLSGLAMVLAVLLMGLVGTRFWPERLALVASSPINLPPAWVIPDPQFGAPEAAHPLGTESNGRDILAIIITGAPRSFQVGLIAAGLGMLIGILFGFTAGFLGGWVDNVIRTLADAVITIPSLALLILVSSYVRVVDISSMALILAIFSWAGPTRLIRAQVLSLRERGYVRMARLSGISTFDIMFREMLPNMLPYLASSLAGNVAGAILAATSLEALGLGPTRIPTLGMTIFYAISSSAVLRGMWWWWGFPILILILIFTGLFLIAIGLDEIANPRLRGATAEA
ncbi:MAG TPA: ABC transporter permease [Chloroflexota bacterium]|nr:ABC transporter permease [Chloroflexota bacterium]